MQISGDNPESEGGILCVVPGYSVPKSNRRQETPKRMTTSGGAQGAKPLLLREHRIKRKVRLEEIAEATKISRRFLEAIEMGEYSKLPGGVFTTSYIRQYAAAIGYEAEEILADCQTSLGEKQPERREPGSEAQASATKWYRFLSLG